MPKKGVLRSSGSTKSLFAPAREYHRRHGWRLNGDGLMVPHSYAEKTPESLSWWDDVGFIFAGRRIMVWWRHPRMVYQDRLEEMAVQQCAEEYPGGEHWLARSKPVYRKVQRGRRKKIVAHEVSPLRAEWERYFDRVNATQASLAHQDHGWLIRPSLRSQVLDWCQGIDLVAPLEVRCEKDLHRLRDLVKNRLRGETETLEAYPAYTFADWQSDQAVFLSRGHGGLENSGG